MSVTAPPASSPQIARVEALVASKLRATVVAVHLVECSKTESAYIVLWRNERDHGTHRAVIAHHSRDAMLIWGHYFGTEGEQDAQQSYMLRIGL